VVPLPPDNRPALQHRARQTHRHAVRTTAKGVDEQFLVEDYQTDAGVIATVDAADDEVRSPFMLVFCRGDPLHRRATQQWRTDYLRQPAIYLMWEHVHAKSYGCFH